MQPYAVVYWDAFARLCSERGVVTELIAHPNPHGGPPLLMPFARELPIPWSALDRYARRLRLTDAEFKTFERMVVALDDEYLTIAAERQRSAVASQDED